MKRLAPGALLLIAALLAGCGSAELLSDLTQEDANGIVVILQQAGVQARIAALGTGQERTFSISVPSRQEENARLVLAENELPRASGLKEILDRLKKTNAFTSETDKHEIHRLVTEYELAQHIGRVPGVIAASVKLSLPVRNPYEMLIDGSVQPRPTASVIVRHWEGRSLTEIEIQELVARGVGDLRPEDVEVVMSGRTPQGSASPPRSGPSVPLFAGYSVLILILAAGDLYLLRMNRALANRLQGPPPDGDSGEVVVRKAHESEAEPAMETGLAV
jgi:type III secretion protein J